MVLKRVDGIVRRADNLHIVAAHQASCRVFGLLQHCRATVIYIACRRGREQTLLTKGSLEFEVSPVIERVAHRIGYGLGPLLKLLPVRCITRAVTLRHAICTHGTPLIVIAIEPYLRKRAETVIRGYILGIEMAVVIDNGHLRRMVVIEALGRRALQQEIRVVKLFHNRDFKQLTLSKYNNLHAKNQYSRQHTRMKCGDFTFSTQYLLYLYRLKTIT